MVTSSPTRECAQCGFGLSEGSASQARVSHSYSAAQQILLLPGQGDKVDVVGKSGDHQKEDGDHQKEDGDISF